jgi:hypothetical protein
MSERGRIRRLQRVIGEVEKKLGKCRFPCLYPGCGKPAISSHSQQKEGQLRAIAKNGLVYALKRNTVFLMKHLPAEHSVPLTPIGIAEASAFWGYCAEHDRDIFGPIERKELIPNDQEQASLFFLRAMSFEYAAKRKGFIQSEMLSEAVGDDADPGWHEHNAGLAEGMKLFLEREGPFYIGQILDMIATRDYSRLHTAWVRVTRTLPISVVTSVCPWLNSFQKKWPPTQPQPLVSFSVVPAPTQTDIACSWLDNCHKDAKWIQGEMQTLEGTQRMVNLLGIAESEDLCINIDFWESLPSSSRQLVLSNRYPDTGGSLAKVPVIIKFT